MLWVPVTIGAALAQTARNALQSGLTATVGTLGATLVRFLFAIPFAGLAWAVAVWGLGQGVPPSSAGFAIWLLVGAVAQIAATALMLQAMHRSGFAVAYAYIKTEPVLLALGGWVLLGDMLPAQAWVGIVLATVGVTWAALPRGYQRVSGADAAPMLLGVAGGALFGLSSLAFRAAILELPGTVPWMAALHTMLFSVSVQSALLLVWLWFVYRRAIGAIGNAWRPSLGAGFAGMLATFLWFTGFALTAAANVRTLALIEMPIAALLNRRVSGRHLGVREWAGMGLVLAGILLLVQAVV